ncbi:MAG: hypothetical protein CME65_08705 [Halobacteriovoraceae bacterium]|nr:hypothetical protein [Halobacteriovoraceae bacterium]
MSDSFSEVTETSFLGNLKNTLMGVLLGPLIIYGALHLVWWNEGRTLETYLGLKEGANQVIEIDSQKIDSNHEGRLVHFLGKAQTSEFLEDGQFGVRTNAIHLNRIVEMYQWKENKRTRRKKKLGGGSKSTTTYTYEKVWSRSQISSSRFKKASEYQNPNIMPLQNKAFSAKDVKVNSFRLTPSLIKEIKADQAIPLDDVTKTPLINQKSGNKVAGHVYYGDSQNPQIGDIRVKFTQTKQTDVSIIGKQHQNTIHPFETSVGENIQILNIGIHNSKSMFEKEQTKNTMIGWAIRLLCLFLAWVGFKLLMGPITALANLFPLLGTIVDAGTSFIAAALAIPLTLTVMGVAWLSHRPLIGGSTLGVAIISLLAFIYLRKKRASKKSQIHRKKSQSIAKPRKEERASKEERISESLPKFIIHGKTKKYGPYTKEKIQSFLERNKIKPTTPISIKGSGKVFLAQEVVKQKVTKAA